MAEQSLTSFEAMTDGNLSVGLAALKEPSRSATAKDIYSCLGVAKSPPIKVVASAPNKVHQNEEKDDQPAVDIVKSEPDASSSSSSSSTTLESDSVKMAVDDGQEKEPVAAAADAEDVALKVEGPMPLPPKEEGEEGEEVEEEQPKHKKHKVKHERR